MNLHGKTIFGLITLAALSAAASPPAAAQKTYIAVGDSLAYGFKSPYPTSSNYTAYPTTGQPGYVAAYANTLAARSGSAYTVLNLGIIGETTSTLLTPASGAVNPTLNSNYAANTSQAALLHTQLTQSGSSVGVITIQVGANDVLQGFEANGTAGAATALQAVQANYTTFLTQIKADEGGRPLTNVTIIGYYDAFANLSPTNPYKTLLASSSVLTLNLNSVLSQEAAAFGARYVDLYTPFAAHYAPFDNYDNYVLANSAPDALPPPSGYMTLFPNDHPTDLGYALIAQTLAAPEPSAVASLCFGVLGLTGLALRARRRRA